MRTEFDAFKEVLDGFFDVSDDNTDEAICKPNVKFKFCYDVGILHRCPRGIDTTQYMLHSITSKSRERSLLPIRPRRSKPDSPLTKQHPRNPEEEEEEKEEVKEEK